MGLEHVRQVYEELGREDPMYAALTSARHSGNRWDPEAFFRRGREEITHVLDYLGALGLSRGTGSALDFGCGAGRLTQALADHFARVTGIDISSTMIENARRWDRHEGRVDYVVNTRPDLGTLSDASFDLVYSAKTLQHIPPANAANYIREFMRVLRPGGIAIFQLRNGPRILPGTIRAWLYHVRRHHLRRLARRIRRRPLYEMHYLARSQVEAAIHEGGGRTVDVVDLSRGRPGRSLRFCAIRDPATAATESTVEGALD
jgi:SAM-dependent methyltransferase